MGRGVASMTVLDGRCGDGRERRGARVGRAAVEEGRQLARSTGQGSSSERIGR